MKHSKHSKKNHDYVEKISDNLYIHHYSEETLEKWAQERRQKDKLHEFIKTDGFHLVPNGRAGTIYYIENGKVAEFGCELAGISEFDILIFFEEVTAWALPQKETMTKEDKSRIKSEMSKWLATKKIKAQL